MASIRWATLLTLLSFGLLTGFFFIQEYRVSRYCSRVQVGKTIIETRIAAQKAFHHYRLANGSELVVEPFGPQLGPVRCRVFFDQYRTVASAFYENL